MASVASSAMQDTRCVVGGCEMSVEQALNLLIANSQNVLNSLQAGLHHLCLSTEQAVDDDQDFRECVTVEHEIIASVGGFKSLLDELVRIAGEIRGDPPNTEMKRWWMAEKKAFKQRAADEKLRLKAEALSMGDR